MFPLCTVIKFDFVFLQDIAISLTDIAWEYFCYLAWGGELRKRGKGQGKGRKKFSFLLNCLLKWNVCMLSRLSHVQLFATLWTGALQAPLYMGFSRQEYWNGLPPPGDLPNPGIELASLTSLALASRFFTTDATWEAVKWRSTSI